MNIPEGLVTVEGLAVMALLTLMGIGSYIEKEPTAGRKAMMLLPVSFVLVLLGYWDYPGKIWVTGIIGLSILVFGIYLFVPAFLFRKKKEAFPKGRIDERTVMFSRKELKPGSDRFKKYYAEHPEHFRKDEQFRQQPGLLSKDAVFYNSLAFVAAEANFFIVDALQDRIEPPVSLEKQIIEPEEAADFVKNWLLKIGVKSVGITLMRDYHWYTVGGRGERYGKPVLPRHRYGIAFTVEMDEEMVKAAPRSSIIMESAQRYLQAGTIAVQLAKLIASLGYEARAHIDGNYQVVAPLVARDANLGEIGRMGLLMTPELGPRVRVGVVTTNMPLVPDKRIYDDSMEDFCGKCMKCAENCPSSAIPFEKQTKIDTVRRWQIDSEACYSYWCKVGTDCGRCMSVCPYSHADNLMHNMVRWAIKMFPNFRWWAVRMDDLFYGRKPAPQKIPGWLKVITQVNSKGKQADISNQDKPEKCSDLSIKDQNIEQPER
ncbi:4Fe-4S dicluster domain-containing protein [Marinilabiliaceae bacterium JC017]|nr:4Fe-4S dicluster domain-containing protein [Marinilabiliaceae bacterium JC017]